MADIPISAVTRRVQYTVGGTDTGPYSFTFNVLADTDLAVYLNSTLKTITTHYTVSLNANGTGSITLTSSPLTTDIVTIISAVPIARVSDYTTGGDFTAAAVNADLDKQTIFSQQLSERIDRSLKSATSESAVTDWDLPAPEAEKALKWNSAGTALENSTDDIDSSATDAAASAAAALVSENAAAADAVLTAADVVTVAADLVATNQDTIDTAADLVATNQDTIDTAADVVLTAADVVSAESAAGAVAVPFTFDNSTSMADPGTGDFRFNNATVGSVTAITLDANSADTGNPDVSDFIATWGASDSGDKAHITFKKSGTPATFATFKITAAVTDNTTHLELTVTHVDSNGTWTAADKAYVAWTRTGDAGAASPSASETVEGIVETATQGEVDAGTDALRYVTPATLANTTVVGGDPAAFSGVIETDATYVATTQPFVMPDGSGTYIATVKDAGADGTVELWKVDTSDVVAGSATASVTLTGAATVTSIAESMGYIIVGSEDGIHIIHKYDTGSWAEATTGWPRSLSTSTTPALVNNDVQRVAATVGWDVPAKDPRTGGIIPTFGIHYGTGTASHSSLSPDGTISSRTATANANLGIAAVSGGFIHADTTSRMLHSNRWFQMDNDETVIQNSSGAPYTFHPDNNLAGADGSWGSKAAIASAEGLGLIYPHGNEAHGTGSGATITAAINRTYNTGCMVDDIRGAWLANSATADRSYKANTLTENGTVPSASADGASGELLCYGPYTGSNYSYLPTSTDLDFGTGDMSIITWFKLTTATTYERLVRRRASGGGGPLWELRMTATGTMYGYVNDGSVGGVAETTESYDDGVWHMAVMTFTGSDDITTVYVNGTQRAQVDNATMGTLDMTAAPCGIGSDGQTLGSTPFSGQMALTRISATAPSAAQIRAMYEAEKGMFETGALVLLQSGTTDAVLDVDVDPNGKVAVTQTDSMTIWDGLTCTTQATLGANTAFEHLKSWNDTLIEVGATDLSISRPAEVIRTVFDEVKVLQDQFAGVDLSKAAAWIIWEIGYGGNPIAASYNIESASTAGTGIGDIVFATPFKAGNASNSGMSYAVAASASNGTTPGWGIGFDQSNSDANGCRLLTDNASDTAGNLNVITAVFFGELEGE